jgi:hypothetical protein
MKLRSQPRQHILLCAAVLLAASALPVLAQSPAATLSYRKVFKDSTPEFLEIKIHEDGSGTCDLRQLDDPPEPQPLQVNPGLAARMFELAKELNYFQGIELDVKRRIANLGQKTFRYARGSDAGEVTFNYTVNAAATQLANIFEGLGRQQEHLTTLERRARYDRLGVNEALLRFEIDLNRRILPEPERLVPVLETIANDTRMIEMARQRARALVERIRSGRPS